MTVNSTSFTCMETITDGRLLPRDNVKIVRTRGGYLITFGCYNGHLRGAQGALSAQRPLEGALCTSAPNIGAQSTSLLCSTFGAC